MPLKVLLINAIDTAREVESRYPPLGLGYVVSVARSRLGEEAVTFRIVDSAVVEELDRFDPDIVGISSVSQNFNRAIAYARAAKDRGKPVICGGVHITMLPASLAAEMEIGVLGEGEETACELVELFLRKRAFSKDDLRKVRGIVFRGDDGAIVTTQPRTLIEPLDRLPLPARDLLTVRKDTYMFTSRGCPYRCTFCASSRFWDRVRFFSADYVVGEIAHLVERFGVTSINFYDDLFAVNVPRVREIVRLLRERRLLGRVKFACAMRANLVTDEVMELLREAGVTNVAIGLESGCPDTLKFLKGNVTVEENARAIATMHRHGMIVHGSFIIGSPRESARDIFETLSFIKRTRPDGFTVYALIPFPGTPVWDYARGRGLVSETMNWDMLKVDFGESHSEAVVMSERLSRDELYGLYLKFREYQTSLRAHGPFARLLARAYRVPEYLSRRMRGLPCR